MNWLAHVYLSRPDVEFRLGNLLADLVRRKDRLGMPPAFLEGIRQHQLIDAFTDLHPIVHRSRSRISGDFPHLTGILVDVFYDHFLALDWEQIADEPLDSFTGRFYADVQSRQMILPAEATLAVQRMVSDDRLGSYRRRDGIELALNRVSYLLKLRTGRDFALERGMAELDAHFDELQRDFRLFFPQLRAHVFGRLVLNR